MGRTLDEVMAGLPEKRQDRIKARAAELHREIEELKALRKESAAGGERVLYEPLLLRPWRQ